MRILTILFLLLIVPPPIHSYERSIRVVVVNPDGDPTSSEHTELARIATQQALDWWTRLAPLPITSSIVSVTTVTTTADYYDHLFEYSPQWEEPDTITVFAVDNLTSHRRFYGFAQATAGQDELWFVLDYPYIPPMAAYLLGFTLFHLPDLSGPDAGCIETDIMCRPATAYEQNIVGCRSLAVMGYPCQKIYLPFLAKS